MTTVINGASFDLEGMYSALLVQQARERRSHYDLSLSAPIIDLIHPKVLKSLLHYMVDPEHEAPDIMVADRFLSSFGNVSELPPGLKVVKGLPSQVGKCLKQNMEDFTLDFGPLGVAHLSKEKKKFSARPGIHQHLLPDWVSYALSPELWGPQGKWPRFHERLHVLFDKVHLLKGEDVPGQYLLDQRAEKLEKFGFVGTLLEDSYVLNLPWTFPLSALNELERVIRQEF